METNHAWRQALDLQTHEARNDNYSFKIYVGIEVATLL